jgi:hypothetical protein
MYIPNDPKFDYWHPMRTKLHFLLKLLKFDVLYIPNDPKFLLIKEKHNSTQKFQFLKKFHVSCLILVTCKSCVYFWPLELLS